MAINDQPQASEAERLLKCPCWCHKDSTKTYREHMANGGHVYGCFHEPAETEDIQSKDDSVPDKGYWAGYKDGWQDNDEIAELREQVESLECALLDERAERQMAHAAWLDSAAEVAQLKADVDALTETIGEVTHMSTQAMKERDTALEQVDELENLIGREQEGHQLRVSELQNEIDDQHSQINKDATDARVSLALAHNERDSALEQVRALVE